MGLHLGWIPNEPGLRPRDFERPAPTEPPPDPGKVAALAAAQHARGLWSRLLFAVGLMALVLFGFVAAVGHLTWCWAVGGGLAVCCWAAVVLLGVRRGRAARRLRLDKQRQAIAHAAELAEYADGKARWEQAEVERIATAPRWLQVAAHEDITRLDVFGGTGAGRQNMVTGLGWELLAQRAVIVLDLTQDRVADGLFLAARRAGIGVQDYELPYDLKETPLLAGLTGEEIASLIVEVMHADDASATAAGRATDLMILKKIIGVLGTDKRSTEKPGDGISMGRLHCALTMLLGDGAAHGSPQGSLTRGEELSLSALFSDGFRQQVTPNLVRLAAVVEPLTALGASVTPREPARLTCLSLAEGPRDVTADLTAALVVQWVTRAISASRAAGSGGERGGDAFGDANPAVILAGADEQSTRHLGRLTAVCERHGIPLIRTFSRLTEESARHLDTRHTAFMRLATRPEAVRAAEHIGLERRFVAGRFSHAHSVSRSRTKTSSESFTHTSGRTEGGATTHTTGTITGQAHSEAQVPRHDQDVHVHVADHRPQPETPRDGTQGDRRADELDRRLRSVEREQASRGPSGERDSGERAPRPRDRAGSGGGGGFGGFGSQKPGSKRTVSARGGKGSQWSSGSGKRGGKPRIDIVKTKTWFTAQHESDSKTKSWSTTQEDSHTVTTSRSRTDGVSVGDEISYELVYDHKVHPETLMALPEEQMLAPHIVEAPVVRDPVVRDPVVRDPVVKDPVVKDTAVEGKAPVTEGKQPMAGHPMAGHPVARNTAVEGKMVALVIDPSVVGTEAVAPVRPHEIPAFEPPAPAISQQVPDYERIAKPAGGSGQG